tara:strand:- start:272 stop:478 length:207 start_codon:yes stop_codon:yes gene_type:complete
VAEGTKKKKKAITVKGVNLSGLTARQQQTMKKHSKHHTAKHLRDMKRRMAKGTSFTAAHKQSQKAVGT